MKNTLRVNHADRTIIMDRTFAKYAENTMSSEYAHLQQVRRDYPNYTVMLRQINLIDNHILPHFRKMRLNEIKVNSLQQFYNDRSHMAQSPCDW